MSKNLLSCCISACIAVIFLAACSPTRYVPEGKYLLDDVKITLRDTAENFTRKDLMTYVRQRPNNKFLHLTRLRLGVYNMSGADTTKWWNRWVRRLGEPPVIYSYSETEQDSAQLLKALNNAGFLEARVDLDSVPDKKRKRIKLNYTVTPGEPHRINSITYEFPNATIRDIVLKDSSRLVVREGDRLDRTLLENEREQVTTRMQNSGYWAFSKEYISFNADTTENSKLVDLTMTVHPPHREAGDSTSTPLSHKSYLVRNVIVIPSFDGADTNPANYQAYDTVRYKGITILYTQNQYLRPATLRENCFITPGEPFRQHDVDRTYSALGRLPILKYSQIRMLPAGQIGDTGLLDAYILLTPGKSQYISFEVEGTNSEGDLGVALGINYSHRNVGRGSETLNLKLRGSYEALNGNFEGFIHDRFMEYSLESSVTFPKFKFPFLRESFKRKINASTELHLSLNYQERPEFTRIISTAGWSYKWGERSNRYRYVVTPLDINYVYLPKSTNNFINEIAPDNPLLRYSYEDHFIMRTGFNFYYTNKLPDSPWRRTVQKDIFNVRTACETAGNLLFGLSTLFNRHPDFHKNPYKVFGINYSQYVRADIDFSYLHTFDKRNSIAMYVGAGIGIPYGNSEILPFEKRFYGGGANGVRGWDVRTLGPGRYPGTNSVSDFIYQCGDIKFNFSVEYRVKLFWVVEGGLFVDMGNIWTIRDYPSQPYGMFRFYNFYKELAAAYGVGIRLDFNYFLVRLDLGMKAHNPAMDADPWPLIHPRWGRDSSLHFSIGYPF